MRLWHEELTPQLPRQQLLGQHRECAALRGAGWGRPHATVNYVFEYSPYKLYQYHLLIMAEMERRGYRPAVEWKEACYRGKSLPANFEILALEQTRPIYPEHDKAYYIECVNNLAQKGIVLGKVNKPRFYQ